MATAIVEEEVEEEGDTAPRPARADGAHHLLRRLTAAVHRLGATGAEIGTAVAAVVVEEATGHDPTLDRGARGRDRGVIRVGRGVGVRHGGAMEVVVRREEGEEVEEEGIGDGRLSHRDGEVGGGGVRVIRAIVAIASVAGVGAGGIMGAGGEELLHAIVEGLQTLGMERERVCVVMRTSITFALYSSRECKAEGLLPGGGRPSHFYIRFPCIEHQS